MDKDKAKKQIMNCFSFVNIDTQECLIAILTNDIQKLDEFRKILSDSNSRCEMYCNQVDECVDEKQIDQVIGSVTLR